MLRLTLLAAGLAMALCHPAIPEPGQLAFSSEDDFEDYLDAWLAIEEPKWLNSSARNLKVSDADCTLAVNGDLGQPQPVYLRQDDYWDPTRATGVFNLRNGESVTIGCTGSGRTIVHPNLLTPTVTGTITCEQGTLVRASWLNGPSEFRQFTCSSHSYHDAEYTGETCYGGNSVIRIGFYVDGVFYPKFWSCFDSNRLEVLYVWYNQRPQNAVHQTGVDRPSWLVGAFFPGVGINNLYTQVTQKATIAGFVGDELADKYVTSYQFLARGHLAAKTDFVFATGQRSSFYFINAAPQWQPFNGGNWNFLEQNLRARIGAAGYDTVIYTGTWGVTQLRNQNDELVDIYLRPDVNNNHQLPIPMYYYKVVYDPLRKIGIAFVSINNPYYTEEEVKERTFCTDVCRNNDNFNWIRWNIDDIATGYSFCCEVDDFRRTVPHLPEFEVVGILY